MIAKSQSFNDNVSNPETELCFYCHTWKTKDEFDTEEGGNICKGCYEQYRELCVKNWVFFTERPRGKPAFRGWYNRVIDLMDVYALKDNKEIFIRGYNSVGEGYNFPDHEKAEIFRLKMQFLHTSGDYIIFHCCNWNEGRIDTPSDRSPLEFIEWIVKKGYHFDEDMKVLVVGADISEFHGNLQEISCAFHFRIFNREYAERVQDKLREVQEALKWER
jgi:hypothetical protein